MKVALIITAILPALVVVSLIVLGVISQSGRAPGIVGGKLAKCSANANCVCTEFESDAKHYIKPLKINADDAAAVHIAQVKHIIERMNGKILASNQNYLATTFTSSMFRFVDDMEIRMDEQEKLIHIRSSSRVGRGDLGVNRKRTEEFKTLFNGTTSKR